MALITPGPLVAQISGKVGGCVFLHNQYADTVRILGSQVNSETFKRSSRHIYLQECLTAWKMASNSLKTSWCNWASRYPRVNRLGQTYYLSGYQFFMSLNMNLKTIGRAINSEEDPDDLLDDITYEELLTIPDAISVEFTEDAFSYHNEIMLFMTAPQSPGRHLSHATDYRFITSIQSLAVQPIVLTTEYFEAFGDLSLNVGQHIYSYAQVINYDHGQVGPKQFLKSIVTGS